MYPTDDLGFGVRVSSRDPRVPPPGAYEAPPCTEAPSTPTQEEEPEEICSDAYAELFRQRDDGQRVGLYGRGDRYGEEAALVEVAESIVDRPQPVQLQFRLAPEGWTVSSYESLAHLALVSEADPTSLTERISVSLQERWRGYDRPDDLLQPREDVLAMAEGLSCTP